LPSAPLVHLAVLLTISVVAFWIALGLTRRRLLS